MTKEELIKNQFPNDEFLQSAVSLIVDKCVAELEQKLEQTEKDLADYQFNYPTINELEKENAELNNFIIQSKKDGISPINALIIKNLGNQLTKAKEIIKKYYKYNPSCEYFYEDIDKEAEQFLEEVEK